MSLNDIVGSSGTYSDRLGHFKIGLTVGRKRSKIELEYESQQNSKTICGSYSTHFMTIQIAPEEIASEAVRECLEKIRNKADILEQVLDSRETYKQLIEKTRGLIESALENHEKPKGSGKGAD
jgi:vacuolar-type H+-ATPase subunit I/STV1